MKECRWGFKDLGGGARGLAANATDRSTTKPALSWVDDVLKQS